MSKSRYESKKPTYQTKPEHCSQPPMGSVAVFEWETFKPLTDYSDQSMLNVFKHITRDIIERPYHYDKHMAFDEQGEMINYEFTKADNVNPPAKVSGVAVYKKNHGTGHAIRQMIYTDALIEQIAKEGTPKGQQIAQVVNNTPEIASILKLAAYCKRIGRTLDNEHDELGHITIYSKRSSEMFAKMAEELGYSKDLILVISESMLEPAPDHSTDVVSKNIAEISGVDLRDFSESVLMAAHMADLSRLASVKRHYITKVIKDYFEPKQLLPVATGLVEMACKANAMTGNSVIGQESGVKHEKVDVNGKKLVAVVNNIAAAISELKTLSLLIPSQKVQNKSEVKPSLALEEQEKQMQVLLYELELKVIELEVKGKKNPKGYGPVAKELRQLHTTLTNEKADFFKKLTAEALKQYSDHCNQAIASLKEAKNHRGWYKVAPILRAIVGVLAFCVALIVEVSSENGYVGTFFKTPETDTAQKVNHLKNKFQAEINEIDSVIQKTSVKLGK